MDLFTWLFSHLAAFYISRPLGAASDGQWQQLENVAVLANIGRRRPLNAALFSPSISSSRKMSDIRGKYDLLFLRLRLTDRD